MDGIDLKKIAAEVSAEHGIRIDPDDPMMAVVTVKRLVFQQAIQAAVEQLQASTDEIDRATARLQLRTGTALAQEFKESTAKVNSELRAATETLVSVAKLNCVGSRAGPRLTWLTDGIAVVVLAFMVGRYLGAQSAAFIHTGG